ncbi:hypothetical protein [Paenibacillus sp. FSL R7-0331]|uniref:hypothetical protein n=1 Tax=Paenibacillus sp. FSL R7-0331 TaxID=1536773 RepID=UPI0004F69582|nr:hypothetical protein [Paenibacillus sp. FSL R7-0331]AIQ53178.1 hypothetical protein R70331_17690 [Paenibacillus sp. FSL R7-0331]
MELEERNCPPESFSQKSSHRKHKLSADFHREQRYQIKKSAEGQRPEVQTFSGVMANPKTKKFTSATYIVGNAILM